MIEVIVVDASGNTAMYALENAPTILAAFQNAGYQYPHGCRVGVCGACMSQVEQGIEHLPAPDFIEQERLKELRATESAAGSNALSADHIRFCCRTPLTGPVTLRPLSGTVTKMEK